MTRSIGAALLLCASTLAMAMPPPGHYRIDGEARVKSGSGPTATERIERWDGATGRRTVITKAGPTGSQQAYAGAGPVTWCVPITSTPPANAPGRCDTRWMAGTGGSAFEADCKAGKLQEHWKQLDASTWERQMSFTSPAAAANASAETAAAMAPVYAQIAEVIRTGTPQQAAEARQQLAALKAAQGGGDAMATTTRLTERWTRIANICKAGA